MNGSLMLTVDVESDWGSGRTRGIEEALPRLLDLLDQYEARATFFVVGDFATPFRKRVRPESRHEVGSHGLTHTPLTRLDESDVAFELSRSRSILEDLGFDVRGFRAPFLRSPRMLPRLLANTGYSYDSSMGSVFPSLRNLTRRRDPVVERGIKRIPPSTLFDRITPFSLTYLRLLHPLGLGLRSKHAKLFYFHLHELLDEPRGWRGLPGPLQRLHARNVGERAWNILERLLKTFRGRTMRCRDFVEAHG